MKVWFCRDMNGTCTVWDGTKGKPILDKDFEDDIDARWDSHFNNCVLLADEGCVDSDDDVFEMFGKSFHGVKKGRCKLLDLEPNVVEVDPVKDRIGYTQVFYDRGKGVDPEKIIDVLHEYRNIILVKLADGDIGMINSDNRSFISFDKDCAWLAE